MHSGLILCVLLVWLKRIPNTQTNEETQVNESINNDPIYICYECKKEISKREGYLCGEGHICDQCVRKDTQHHVIMIDSENFYCDSFETAKYVLKTAVFGKNDRITDLSNLFIVSQQNGRFWFGLTQDKMEPTKFKVTLHAPKEEVATKYLRRLLEDCMYRMNYLINPEDYQCEEAEEDNYYTYYINKALCVMCGEINYAEPVCEVEGHTRMVCCDCIEIANRCEECNHLTIDYLYESRDDDGVYRDLCFDCKFKNSVRGHMPLTVHLAIRSDIQFLTRQQFDILVDYAELCKFTIFDAYRYKSKCHYYDCERMVPPSQWDSEEKIQFCCRRHCEMSELNGCHCQNVYDGSHYDEEYEKATCKVCNSSNHETNMIPRIALRESDQGVKPIVSAICVFEEGIKMSNILAYSLVDLYEYFI